MNIFKNSAPELLETAAAGASSNASHTCASLNASPSGGGGGGDDGTMMMSTRMMTARAGGVRGS
jgi:hypothetical protein